MSSDETKSVRMKDQIQIWIIDKDEQLSCFPFRCGQVEEACVLAGRLDAYSQAFTPHRTARVHVTEIPDPDSGATT